MMTTFFSYLLFIVMPSLFASHIYEWFKSSYTLELIWKESHKHVKGKYTDERTLWQATNYDSKLRGIKKLSKNRIKSMLSCKKTIIVGRIYVLYEKESDENVYRRKCNKKWEMVAIFEVSLMLCEMWVRMLANDMCYQKIKRSFLLLIHWHFCCWYGSQSEWERLFKTQCVS